MSKKNKAKTSRSTEDEKFPLPIYKKEDDIYNREQEESLDEEGNAGKRSRGQDEGPGEGLDVPGGELDDSAEAIGEEDEENNYYSLGGDAHDDLEEDKE